MGPCTTVKPERTRAWRWTYLATAIEEWLKSAAKRKYISAIGIPPRVFGDARGFLARVREASGKMQRGMHPPQGEDAAAHAAAWDAFDECVRVERRGRQAWLRRGSQFLTDATRAHRLSNEEAKCADELARFFGHIKQIAERAQDARAMAQADDE